MFCDTEMTCVAGLMDKLIHLDHLGFVFPHRHYSHPNGLAKDETNERTIRLGRKVKKFFAEESKKILV